MYRTKPPVIYKLLQYKVQSESRKSGLVSEAGRVPSTFELDAMTKYRHHNHSSPPTVIS